MTANINPETGIRYGVIACNSLNQHVVEELWYGPGAVDISYKEALEDLEAEIRREVEFEQEDGFEVDDPEDEIQSRLESRAEWIEIDEPTIKGTYEGVEYIIGWLGGAPLVWITKSPFVGKFDRCSPCVPGAVSLESPNPGGVQGYDVPPDWRDSNGET